MVKVIYFDYHGVLDRHTFRGLLETMGRTWAAKQSGEVASLIMQFVEQERTYGYDYATGIVLPQLYWKRIAEQYGPDVDTAGRQYLLHVQPVRQMWNLLSDLHDRFNLGLFSDCSLDKKEVIRSAYALTDYFDYLIFSCDVRMSKRDPNFHRLMLQSGLYQPDECLVVDDSVDNLNLSSTLGFQTHIFHDEPTTRDHLMNLNQNLNAYSR